MTDNLVIIPLSVEEELPFISASLKTIGNSGGFLSSFDFLSISTFLHHESTACVLDQVNHLTFFHTPSKNLIQVNFNQYHPKKVIRIDHNHFRFGLEVLLPWISIQYIGRSENTILLNFKIFYIKVVGQTLQPSFNSKISKLQYYGCIAKVLVKE